MGGRVPAGTVSTAPAGAGPASDVTTDDGAPRLPDDAPRSFRPAASSAGVAARMSRQARRDTAPEVALRRELHRRGLRFRVEYPIPGMPRRRADIAFTRAKIAVFVDGCFWHGCPDHKGKPAANAAWWAAKLAGNVARDHETDAHLRALGWTVLRFWEHTDIDSAADAVVAEWVARLDRPPPGLGPEPAPLDGRGSVVLGSVAMSIDQGPEQG